MIGWRKHVVTMMAFLVATTHKTFLTTNLVNYATRKVHGLVLTDDRFAAIKALKTADYNKVISAVTYGDTPKTREERITEIVARRPSTRKSWDTATAALVKAITALKACPARPLVQPTDASKAARKAFEKLLAVHKAVDKAFGNLSSALHPRHEAWEQAEVLRGIWRRDVTINNGNVSQMSERVYELLTFCRPIGRELQALAEKAAKARKARVLIKGKPLPGMTDPRRKKRKWAFTLAPVMDIDPKFVPLTTTAMKALFEELAKVHPYLKKKLDETKAEMAKIDAQNEDMEGEEADIGDDVVDEAVGGDDVVDEAVGGDAVVDEAVGGDAGDANAKKVAKSFCVWSAMTNVDRALRKKFFKNPLQRRFGNFVMTDGVGVSLNVRRRKPKLECDRIDLVRDIGKQKRFVAQYNAPNGLVEQRAELINEVANAKAVKDDAATATAKLKAVRAKINEAVKPALEADALLIDLKEKLDNVKKALTPADPYVVSAALKEKLDVTYDRKTQTYKAKDGSVIKGIDPGLKAIGTAVGLAADGTFEKAVDMSSGELRYLTGEKQYTKKKTRLIKAGCSGWLACPSLKTELLAELDAGIDYRVELLGTMEQLLYDKLWSQKQRMRKFVKRQRALETVTARFCGTKNKVEQKQVVIALGDASLPATMKVRIDALRDEGVSFAAHCALGRQATLVECVWTTRDPGRMCRSTRLSLAHSLVPHHTPGLAARHEQDVDQTLDDLGHRGAGQ